MSIHVVAHIPAKADSIEKLRSVLGGLIEPTRKEAGGITYQLFQNVDNPADFTFIEEWESRDALNRHLETPHLTAALRVFPSILAAEPDIRVYNLVA